MLSIHTPSLACPWSAKDQPHDFHASEYTRTANIYSCKVCILRSKGTRFHAQTRLLDLKTPRGLWSKPAHTSWLILLRSPSSLLPLASGIFTGLVSSDDSALANPDPGTGASVPVATGIAPPPPPFAPASCTYFMCLDTTFASHTAWQRNMYRMKASGCIRDHTKQTCM